MRCFILLINPRGAGFAAVIAPMMHNIIIIINLFIVNNFYG